MRLAALYFREVRKMSPATVAPQTDLPHSIKPVNFFTQPRRLLSVLGQCSFSKKKNEKATSGKNARSSRIVKLSQISKHKTSNQKIMTNATAKVSRPFICDPTKWF